MATTVTSTDSPSRFHDVGQRDFGPLLAAVVLQRLATRHDLRPTLWPLGQA